MSLSKDSKNKFRKMLVDLRQQVLDQVKDKFESTREGSELGDLGDNATRDLAAEYAYLFSDRLRKRLLLIDEALEALTRGDYGLCEDCNERINEKRLMLMPFTRWCVRCQSKREKEAKMRGESMLTTELREFSYPRGEEDEES
ncbi:MAG: zinc finger transcriptional regulator, TraR/DksA family [Deltaproteobacteria bacterium]|nr:zinc finger transcriptional regulator, TraR/DksA family [Deltaproteobacteria bacterium]